MIMLILLMQVKVEFDTTPRMSTYLAAWVVAPFESISAETETNKINVSVVTSKEKINQVNILNFLSHNFFRCHLPWTPL